MEKAFAKISLNDDNVESPIRTLRNRTIPKPTKPKLIIEPVTSKSVVEPITESSAQTSSSSLNATYEIEPNEEEIITSENSGSDSDSNVEDDQYYCEDEVGLDQAQIEITEETETNQKCELLTILKTKRNKPMAAQNGYFYLIDRQYEREDGEIQYNWRCRLLCSATKCRAKSTSINFNASSFTVYEEHNHIPDPDAIAAKVVEEKIIDRARITVNVNPGKVIRDVQKESTIDKFQAAKLIRHRNLTQRISRERSKLSGYGSSAPSREMINLDEELKVTYDGDCFICGDSGDSDIDRVITFATEANLSVLSDEDRWYGDGTFKICPLLFKQVYTVNIIKQGKNLPLFYALLPDKSSESYNKMFDQLVQSIKKFKPNFEAPRYFVHDFEKAALKSIESRLKGAQIEGCYFHFVQCLWKRMQKVDLTNLYCSDTSVRLSFKYLKCLAFVPTSKVIPVFEKISSLSNNKFLPMITYFEKNFIGKKKNNSKNIRLVPRYPIQIWNVRQRIIENVGRTNNSLESWHKVFADNTKKHPTVNKLIECFRIEQKNTEILIAQLEAGDNYERKKSEVKKDELILDHINKFETIDLIKFLDILIQLLD